MKTVKIRNVVLGDGIPKICIPLVGITKEDILAEAETIQKLPFDLVEWRADYFQDVLNCNKVLEVLINLRSIMNDIPILFTFRTSKEGGNLPINIEKYVDLNIDAVNSGLIDLIDVEGFSGDRYVKSIITHAHKQKVKVIVSNHDFYKTPSKEVIINRLCKMQSLGGDVFKIAVMPNNNKDVLTLLEATAEMYEQHAEGPIITMSMSKQGGLSRIAGEYFGSALTFGAAHNTSAPGQINAEDLYQILNIIHKYS